MGIEGVCVCSCVWVFPCIYIKVEFCKKSWNENNEKNKNKHCYGLNDVFPNFMCWNPNFHRCCIRKWAFGRWLGYEVGVFINRSSALIKMTQNILAPFTRWERSEMASAMYQQVNLHQPPQWNLLDSDLGLLSL